MLDIFKGGYNLAFQDTAEVTRPSCCNFHCETIVPPCGRKRSLHLSQENNWTPRNHSHDGGSIALLLFSHVFTLFGLETTRRLQRRREAKSSRITELRGREVLTAPNKTLSANLKQWLHGRLNIFEVVPPPKKKTLPKSHYVEIKNKLQLWAKAW